MACSKCVTIKRVDCITEEALESHLLDNNNTQPNPEEYSPNDDEYSNDDDDHSTTHSINK